MSVIYQSGVPHALAGLPGFGHAVAVAPAEGVGSRRRILLAVSLAPSLVSATASTGAMAQVAPQVWFSQPTSSLAANFIVSAPAKRGVFHLIQHQPNPYTTDHADVPVDWDMSGNTGLAAAPPLGAIEAGTVNRAGATGVQMDGDTIGINLNSLDFSGTGTNYNLVGIMPCFEFTDLLHKPFANAGATLVFSIDMQVPSAQITPPADNPRYGGQPFVAMDLRFTDTTHPLSPPIEVSVGTFALYKPGKERIGYTPQGGGRILMLTSLRPGNSFVTVVPDTTLRQQQVWRGFKSFAVAMTAANLHAGIQAIMADTTLLASLGLTPSSYSSNPADYALSEVHLNSELNYAGPPPAIYHGGSVQLGLSERHMKVILE